MEKETQGSFDDMFKKFDEINFSRKSIEDCELHNIPSGSQEFQKALWSNDEETDDVPMRQRSHTIDSSYTKPKRHLSVHFSCDLDSPKQNTKEEEDYESAASKLDKIMKNHLGVVGVRQRSNTLDGTYRKDKKFITVPHRTIQHHYSNESVGSESGKSRTNNHCKKDVRTTSPQRKHSGSDNHPLKHTHANHSNHTHHK